MVGFSVIIFAACALVCNVGVSSGFGFPQPVNAFRQAHDIQNFVHNQIRGIAAGIPVPAGPGSYVFNGPHGAGVVSAAGAGGGVVSTGGTGGTFVSTSTGGSPGGFVSTLGGGGGRYGGGSTFVSSGGPAGGYGVIQTSSNIDGKQSGQVLINDNGKVTAYELPPGGGTVFTVQSGKGGPGVASSSYSSSYNSGDGEKSSGGGVINDNGKEHRGLGYGGISARIGGNILGVGTNFGTGCNNIISTGTSGGTNGFVRSSGGGGARYNGGSGNFVSSGGPGGGFSIIQTFSNFDGKQSGQVLINDNGKVTVHELPPGGGSMFFVQSSQGGPSDAWNSYSRR